MFIPANTNNVRNLSLSMQHLRVSLKLNLILWGSN